MKKKEEMWNNFLKTKMMQFFIIIANNGKMKTRARKKCKERNENNAFMKCNKVDVNFCFSVNVLWVMEIMRLSFYR